MSDRKEYPLKVPRKIWADFKNAKDAKASHLSMNDAIIEALIKYSAASQGTAQGQGTGAQP